MKKDKMAIPDKVELIKQVEHIKPLLQGIHKWLPAKLDESSFKTYRGIPRIYAYETCKICGTKRKTTFEYDIFPFSNRERWEKNLFQTTFYPKNYKQSECYKKIQYIRSDESKKVTCPKCKHKFIP